MGIVTRVVAEGRDPQSTNVREVASSDIVTVDPQQELSEALRLMAEHAEASQTGRMVEEISE